MGHKRMPGLRCVDGVWHIQKRIRGYGTLRESTKENEYEKAERYLVRRLDEIREQLVYGVRPKRFFADAAAKFIEEDVSTGASDNRIWLAQAMPFIGQLALDNIHDETLKPFITWCRQPKPDKLGRMRKGNKNGSIANKLELIRRILRLAAGKWRDPVTGKTWLDSPPIITMPDDSDAREPYPLTWKEQALLFPLLPSHLQPMALFDVHTGLRDEELCGLRWDWEQEIEGFGMVFIIPRLESKNRQARVVMLNAVARSIIEAQRGQHPEYVFSYQSNRGRGRNSKWAKYYKYEMKTQPRRIVTMNNTGWQVARAKAVKLYQEQLGRPAPAGFRTLHVHDLRHTFGRRLRAAGVEFETRQDLLGHKNGNVTTLYSPAEMLELYRAVEKIESGASAPLLASVQKTCRSQNDKGIGCEPMPLISNGAPGRI